MPKGNDVEIERNMSDEKEREGQDVEKQEETLEDSNEKTPFFIGELESKILSLSWGDDLRNLILSWGDNQGKNDVLEDDDSSDDDYSCDGDVLWCGDPFDDHFFSASDVENEDVGSDETCESPSPPL